MFMTQASSHGFPAPAGPAASLELRFDAAGDTDTVRNLSAAAILDSNLFLASDEGTCIERLTFDGEGWRKHVRIDLCDLLSLKDTGAEADLEGLAISDGWLWVVGSHARTRPKAEKAEDECINLEKLADLKDTRPRCLFARLPLVRTEEGWLPVKKDGVRRAGLLKQGKHGNGLAKFLKKSPLMRPFTEIPAKEGGVDVEGIAVFGDRVALGMRGPVIGGHALLIELQLEGKQSGKLHIAGDPVFRMLALEGLGVRDLDLDGDDLLILAGPTSALSGPCALYRWRDWANDAPRDARKVRLHRPERELELPFGSGFDHPEGISVWKRDGAGRRLFVACDSPGEQRLNGSGGRILADIFDLP
jgi:hypothetical protein